MHPPKSVLRPRRRRRKMAPLVVALCVVLPIALGILQTRQGGGKPSGDAPGKPPAGQSQIVTAPSIPRAPTGTGVTVTLLPEQGERLDEMGVYEMASQSIVSVESKHKDGVNIGTGIVLTQDGYIITNAHVVEGARSVEVLTEDYSSYTARMVGYDETEDLAVLKIQAEGLIPARFGDSNHLRCGQSVCAIGDALGYRATITSGIVSALYQDVEVGDAVMPVIQTSAAINHGNSGGALLNDRGQVVGVVVAKMVSGDGSTEAIGFAIPTQRMKYVVDTLIAGGDPEQGFFGITVYLQRQPGGGLKVMEVAPDSDAAAKGIREGDVILRANGMDVRVSEDLSKVKLPLGPGGEVELECRRDGEDFTVTVALGGGN